MGASERASQATDHVGEPGADRVGDVGRRPLFDRESLAAYLRLSTDTVDRLVKAGRLPCVRIGHQVRFTAEDVDGFIERHRQLGPTT
jgi:excisionase family DNA binding protein